jgi:hypothetical protein
MGIVDGYYARLMRPLRTTPDGAASQMDDFTKRIYADAIAEQCRFALHASRELDHWMKEMNRLNKQAGDPTPQGQASLREEQDRADDRFWLAIQSFVVSAANVSKFLWPPRPESRASRDQPIIARCLDLREWLGIGEDSALKSRELRNHLEHFDERIDAWAKGGNTIYADQCFGPAGKPLVHGEDVPDGSQIQFRSYDPARGVVGFQGDYLELRPLHAALKDLLEKIRGLGQQW